MQNKTILLFSNTHLKYLHEISDKFYLFLEVSLMYTGQQLYPISEDFRIPATIGKLKLFYKFYTLSAPQTA